MGSVDDAHPALGDSFPEVVAPGDRANDGRLRLGAAGFGWLRAQRSAGGRLVEGWRSHASRGETRSFGWACARSFEYWTRFRYRQIRNRDLCRLGGSCRRDTRSTEGIPVAGPPQGGRWMAGSK